MFVSSGKIFHLFFSRSAIASSVLIVLVLSACTVAETGGDASSEGLESGGLELPSVQMPALRLSSRTVVPIESLMAEGAGESVAVSGTVAQRVAILGGWLYEVQDDTGSLWVLTKRSEPTVGELATVEGVVHYEPIVVGEIDAGSVYLEEASYRGDS
ncbi:MAG: hypothetical protein ACFB16_04070 [Phormidesmis sp.]